jgi:NAD-reducing hydrogenase large subunit
MMSRRVVIDPVTRIEGHAKITIQLDDAGAVHDARFHVGEFRGFERFCVGRPFWEMPGLTARICGICPISHLIASAKAGDAILAVAVPPAAAKLRRLANLAQIVQSHALSFFHLSAPDLLLGWDATPERRNIFGLVAAEPELARGGIRLRQFGQQIIERLGGKRVHPAWTAPGGVREALTHEHRDAILEALPEANAVARKALDRLKRLLDDHPEDADHFGNFPTLFMGLVGPEGSWEHYDGRLRVVDERATIVADRIEPARYTDYIGEAVESDSYLKTPYYKPHGYPDGMYRVGPLARLNVCVRMGTPKAETELREYRGRTGVAAWSSFQYHYARLIEIVAALERIAALLDDPDLMSDRIRARAAINELEGIGVSEAPRGTLFHHYQVDPNGLLTRVNLIIATGQNSLAMNRTILQIAKRYIRGPEIPESMLNRVEAGIRAFDPCLSCSTHALGAMPLRIRLVGAGGELIAEARREPA